MFDPDKTLITIEANELTLEEQRVALQEEIVGYIQTLEKYLTAERFQYIQTLANSTKIHLESLLEFLTLSKYQERENAGQDVLNLVKERSEKVLSFFFEEQRHSPDIILQELLGALRIIEDIAQLMIRVDINKAEIVRRLQSWQELQKLSKTEGIVSICDETLQQVLARAECKMTLHGQECANSIQEVLERFRKLANWIEKFASLKEENLENLIKEIREIESTRMEFDSKIKTLHQILTRLSEDIKS